MGLLMDSVITLSVIPIVPFFDCFFIGKGLKKDKKKTFMLAMDVTTFFYYCRSPHCLITSLIPVLGFTLY